jgi:hypothetical protein
MTSYKKEETFRQVQVYPYRRNCMEKIKVIHDTIGQTLTVWFDDPAKEFICEETSERLYSLKIPMVM